MIVNQIKNWPLYFEGEWAEKVFDFYEQIDESTKDGEYPIIGESLFCKILTYETKTSDWITESHQDYVDIQILLYGEEIINIFPSSSLTVKDLYNKDIDCTFYNLPIQKPLNSLYLTPNIMGVFYPQDAHTTQIAPNDNIQTIRKVVFKVHKKFFK